MKRKLDNWIDAFVNHTNILPSPELFRKWAGIATVAAAMERKVWVKTYNTHLYPNLYTLLVAPPGIGKTVLTSYVQDLYGTLEKHHLAPSALSRASLVDALHDATRNEVRPQETPSVITFNSMFIAINELSTIMPGYDNDFMGTLTDIYDGKRYGERKRGKDINFIMLAPQLNMLAATSPSYLNELMPLGAWDQGFISRVILIYSGETLFRDPFAETLQGENPHKDLVHDLKIIGALYGRMTFEEEAAKVLTEWARQGGPPKPDHPRLIHYSTRRTAHLLKLCQIASVARNDELKVTMDDYQTALNWLIEAEVYMPDIFKSMAVGGDARAIEDCWYYTYHLYLKEKKPINESRIINFLQQKVPAHSVMRVLDIMVRSKLFDKELDGYKPLMRRQV